MGVYINMEMPENCWSCRMFYNCYACEGHYCRCAALDEVIGRDDKVLRDKRRDDCPLIPVPPHRRLIDADVLYEDCALDNRYEVAATTTRINEYMQLKIDVAPTVIPAEEVEI